MVRKKQIAGIRGGRQQCVRKGWGTDHPAEEGNRRERCGYLYFRKDHNTGKT